MLLAGHWLLCDDGVLRPIFRGRMAALDGSLVSVEFLADVGADRTVLCAGGVRDSDCPLCRHQCNWEAWAVRPSP